jgi:hypothetical protein
MHVLYVGWMSVNCNDCQLTLGVDAWLIARRRLQGLSPPLKFASTSSGSRGPPTGDYAGDSHRDRPENWSVDLPDLLSGRGRTRESQRALQGPRERGDDLRPGGLVARLTLRSASTPWR